MNPHNSFTFFTEKETAEAFSSLIPPLNNIILSYLEGLPDWCYLYNKIRFGYTLPSWGIHFIKGIIQHIVIGDNLTLILLTGQLPSYNLNKILNCSSIP
jgi:hypothetical protein